MHKSISYYFTAGAMFAIVFAGIGCSNAAEVSNSPNNTAPIQQSKPVVSRDDTEYPKVQIGDQIWMAKNLNVIHFNNGDTIPATITDQEWAAAGQAGKPAWICPYNNCSGATSKGYGRLYNWYAVSDSRGLCPEGWHIPSKDEVNTMISFLGGAAKGGKIKVTGTKDWAPPNSGATNETGFTALGTGYCYPGGGFDYGGYGSWFWTSAVNESAKASWQDITPYAYALKLKENDSISLESNDKEYGFSVRCIADS